MKKPLLSLLLSATMLTLSAQNWTPVAVGQLPTGVVIFSISAVGDNIIWATASKEYYQPPVPDTVHPLILRSADGGQTWMLKEVEEAVASICFQIVAVDSLTAYISTQDFGSGSGRAVYVTTDGGDIWTKKVTNGGAGVALNRFSDGQHWLAHNRQNITRSVNNGANWQTSTITGYQNDEFQILTSGTNMSCTVGDTLWNGTSSGRIIRFTNFGTASEFITTGLGTFADIRSVAFQDHEKGLCYSLTASSNQKISKSEDGGSTWSVLSQQPGNSIGWNIAAVPGSPGTYVLASNYNQTLGKIAITRDFGNTWAVQNINKSLNAVTFTSPTTGWVGGGRITSDTQPALFKYTGSPLVGTTIPTETLPGFSFSPNPASEIIQFHFEGGPNPERVFSTLTDAAGHIVFQGAIQNNQLDVSYLPSGVYLLRVETKDGWAVRKMVRE